MEKRLPEQLPRAHKAPPCRRGASFPGAAAPASGAARAWNDDDDDDDDDDDNNNNKDRFDILTTRT